MTPTSFILFNVSKECYGEEPYAIVSLANTQRR